MEPQVVTLVKKNNDFVNWLNQMLIQLKIKLHSPIVQPLPQLSASPKNQYTTVKKWDARDMMHLPVQNQC